MYNCVYISTTWTPSDSTTRWIFSLLHRSLPLPGGLFNLGGHPSAADPAVAGLGTLATCKRHGETCGNCRSTVFFQRATLYISNLSGYIYIIHYIYIHILCIFYHVYFLIMYIIHVHLFYIYILQIFFKTCSNLYIYIYLFMNIYIIFILHIYIYIIFILFIFCNIHVYI